MGASTRTNGQENRSGNRQQGSAIQPDEDDDEAQEQEQQVDDKEQEMQVRGGGDQTSFMRLKEQSRSMVPPKIARHVTSSKPEEEVLEEWAYTTTTSIENERSRL